MAMSDHFTEDCKFSVNHESYTLLHANYFIYIFIFITHKIITVISKDVSVLTTKVFLIISIENTL